MVRKLEENSRLFRIVVDLVQSMQVRKLDTVCAVAKAALYGLYVVEGAQGFRRSPALTRSLICCKFWLPDAKHAASTLPEEVRDLHLPRTDRFDTQEFDTVVERVEEVEEDEDKAAQRILVQCRDGGTVKSIFVDSAQECCICMVNQANVVLVPCGHCHLCTHCLAKFVGDGKSNITCPTCRQLVSSAHELVPLTQHARERPILDMILQREERKSSMKGGSNGSAFYRWTNRKGALKSALKSGGYGSNSSTIF